ncbi:hypothetical protein P175DRAFT_0433060 [Aspergillus ochraceoroseus IBT 24754]|uniref:Rhodopsin domain-containing protein n=1 Tax=Aspergillus ochraceoroseus IBT 24754 TaxID=1392256 RepID=A0A2T5M4Z6_9EURO|nr:uncharacterized protein P175DRAFT_0433060 [Aspergillus ochraceoroseus IBT 24754]PTU23610.1 hypothetical protein P175DRAFT_0433060 [Aspergillus ochraceoroseus IBT 24754]
MESAQYPRDSRRNLAIFAISFALILSTTAVGLRLLSRKITKSRMYLDDHLIILALIFKYGCSFGAVGMLYNGLGTHIWLVPAERLTTYLEIVYAGSFLYTGCITFIKLSILSFYKRLFPVKPMVIAVNLVGSLVILWCFSVCLVGGLVCIPVDKLWNPAIVGGCLDLAKFYYGLQIPNIATDAIILVMPMKIVWGLQMAKAQKVILCGIFMVGALTLIFDMIRLAVMIRLSQEGDDVTYNQTPASAWTCIEAAVGIMAACLPSLRPLLTTFNKHVWYKLSTRKTSSNKGESGESGKSLESPCRNSVA